jgi:NhaA family Na+:H+ antiporter
MSNDRPFGPSSHSPKGPPGAWAPARRLAKRALAPVETFLAIEAASGIVLLAAAALALFLANSRWHDLYEQIWQIPLGLRLGSWAFERPLHFWINDGLMTVFFFVVGLEIRCEILGGELRDWRRAALPLTAALGGMIVPAGIFLACNATRPSAHGWGVPMATDIAFAVGVLALLGKRIPSGLRVLLLALAVIDDLGAILVIALAYSSSLSPLGFAVAGVGMGLIFALQKFGVRSGWGYVLPALLVWMGIRHAGIHPTLAGVIVGVMTPVRAWLGPEAFLDVTASSVQVLRESAAPVSAPVLLPSLGTLNVARRDAVSPAERLQYALHRWVAFVIMPLFAFANAGVPIDGVTLDAGNFWLFIGVAAGLAVGKPVGVIGLSWVAARLGLVTLPSGSGWHGMAIVGLCAGIGFTMALFIAQLAFPAGALMETSKLGVLCGSALAALLALGYGVLKPAVRR